MSEAKETETEKLLRRLVETTAVLADARSVSMPKAKRDRINERALAAIKELAAHLDNKKQAT